MSRNNNDDDWIFWAIAFAIGLLALLIWQFSEFFGLDFSTGSKVFFQLFLFVLGLGAVIKFGSPYGPVNFGNTWPIFLGWFWVCWWPALAYWAGKEIPSFLDPDTTKVWWNAWYTRWGVLSLLVGGGYTVRHVFSED